MDDQKKPSDANTLNANATNAAKEEILSAVTEGFRLMNANIQLIGLDVEEIKDRVETLEDWKKTTEKRAVLSSDRVRDIVKREPSNADLKNESELAKEIIARELSDRKISAINAKVTAVDIKIDTLDAKQNDQIITLGKLLAIADKPIVKKLGYLLVAAAVMWVGGWMQSYQARAAMKTEQQQQQIKGAK